MIIYIEISREGNKRTAMFKVTKCHGIKKPKQTWLMWKNETYVIELVSLKSFEH